MDYSRKEYFFLFVFLFITNSFFFAQNNMRGPKKTHERSEFELYGKGKNTILNFYQTWISPVKGGNLCSMHPSCSQYSKIAFAKKPSYNALMMTFDRLLRCGHELHFYKEIIIQNRRMFHDPIIDETNFEY